MNPDQQRIFNRVKAGGSVLISGSAGTGKSFTIENIVSWCKTVGKNVGVTALTGMAAITISGRTIHSFLGVGLARKSAYELYMNARKNKTLTAKLNMINILIIDEISMMSTELFDKVSEYLQHVRKSKRPFGGVQLVFCGDMCQLPPVDGDYCFNSEVWKSMDLEICILSRIMRQKDDELFRDILENARFGVCTDEHLEILKAQRNQKFGEIQPTILYSKNVNVDVINNCEYEKLKTEHRVYQTIYSKNKNTKAWADSLKIPESVSIKIGAQMMLTANLAVDDGYANGTRCMVTGFAEDGPIVVFKDGTQLIIIPYCYTDDNRTVSEIEVDDDEMIWATCLPLKLAYALTIHKSQSMTLDAAIIDIGPSIFAHGQAYTALSRVRDLKSVRIINVSKSSFKVHPDVMKFYNK
jgi:ATP-dependent DNA helicase PIF1